MAEDKADRVDLADELEQHVISVEAVVDVAEVISTLCKVFTPLFFWRA
jgi:hypothetical protein